MIPNKNIIELSSHCIKKKLGNSKDIPPELANTLANVYYNTIGQSIEEWHRNNPGQDLFNHENPSHDEILAILDITAPDSSNDIKTINKMIGSYREIRETETPRAAKYIAQIIIDTMKYKIENAPQKSELKRWFERKAKKKNISEIPGLINMLGIE